MEGSVLNSKSCLHCGRGTMEQEIIQQQARCIAHEIRNHLSICELYSEIIKKNNIRFDTQLHYYEDYLFNLSFFRFVRFVYTIGSIFYNYVQHEGGRLSGKYTLASVRIRVTEDIKDMSALLPSNAESREYDMMEYYNSLLNCVDSEVQHAPNYKTVFCCIDYLLAQIKLHGFYKDFKRFIGRRKYVFLLRNRYSIFILLMFKKCLLSIIRR